MRAVCDAPLLVQRDAVRAVQRLVSGCTGCGSKPTGDLQRKSTGYGLNGHRANFAMALSLGPYEHAI